MYAGASASSDSSSYAPGISRRFLIFYPQGLVTTYYPAEGPDGYTPKSGQGITGGYGTSGNVLGISWETGDTVTSVIAADGSISLSGVSYVRLDPLNNTRFEGTYERLGGEPAWPSITFRGDGSFSDEGVAGFTGLLILSSSAPKGSGTYSISNNTLHLRYDNGGKIDMGIYVAPQFLSDREQIELAGFSFARSK